MPIMKINGVSSGASVNKKHIAIFGERRLQTQSSCQIRTTDMWWNFFVICRLQLYILSDHIIQHIYVS